MIVLDTTVLVYAVGDHHPLRDPCRRLVDAIAAGSLAATTPVEVIQEFVHVRARRHERRDAVRVAGSYAELLSPLMIVTPDDLRTGLDLFERYESLGAFDAVLVAAAGIAGADALVSADAAFAGVSAIRHVVPDHGGVTALLAG